MRTSKRFRTVYSVLIWTCSMTAALMGGRAAAQPAGEGQQAAQAATGGVPLARVVLFNSGVGFFEHRGQIEGDAQVQLKFNVESINDLLKSMVLEDQGGGRISTVTYGSRDPITKTLQTFAIDLTNNPTLAELLEQVRGERVEIEAPNKIEGTIVGVEQRKQKVGDDVVTTDMLNLLTDEGLRSVALETVGRIRLANPALDAELRQALSVLALGHATDKKTVTLNFLGNGQRNVRVGYIQESPIWKTSYRLVLREDEAPFLQGWAIVENTTEEDWNDVALTLVSGRPISFIMDLYQPLYVPRPVVEPELFASLRPQTYGQDLARKDAEFGAIGGGMGGMPAAPGQEGRAADVRRLRAGGLAERDKAVAEDLADSAYFDPQQGVQSLAQAGDVGELFQYVIDMPVTLPRQQSAMLPIVNDSVDGKKLVIYNPAVHAKHPLNGLRLANSTGLHLMQGPITVFDGGAYAGDARIEDLPPGSERLISYALDLDTEVSVEATASPTVLVSCRLVKGNLHSSHKHEREQKYVVKNSGGKEKQVLIEYPFDSNWTLVEPKEPAEKTRDLYRFALAAEPGKPAEIEVREQRTIHEQVAISNLDDGTIQYYIQSRVVSDEVKKALEEIVRRKQELGEVAARRQQVEQQLAVIDQEQARIRQNMEQLDRTSDLYVRYVQKFGEQEDQVEMLRGQVRELADQESELRRALDEYLLGLDLK